MYTLGTGKKCATTQRRSAHACTHDLRPSDPFNNYQLNSRLSSIYGGYRPKTLLNKPSNSLLYRSSRLTPARNLQITTDQYGCAQVWATVGEQSGPGANVVKDSHPAAFGNGVTFIFAH